MTPRPIPVETLEMSVHGRNLASDRLKDQWGDRPTLLVFLRHLGCIFCADTMAELRKIREARPDFPEIVYVHPATVADGDAFFEQVDPSARAIADPDQKVYRAFGIKKAKLGQVLGPGVVACGIRAFSKGHRQTSIKGDPWLMTGFFLVRGDQVVKEYPPRHVADRPDLEQIRADAVASGVSVAV